MNPEILTISQALTNKPPPLNKAYNRDPNIKALQRKRFSNHGSTLESLISVRGSLRAKASARCGARTSAAGVAAAGTFQGVWGWGFRAEGWGALGLGGVEFAG